MLIDLGFNSYQVDDADWGFSYMSDGYLDMRYNQTDIGSIQANPTTAADLLNTLPEHDLIDIMWKYGNERQAKWIAEAIVNEWNIWSM